MYVLAVLLLVLISAFPPTASAQQFVFPPAASGSVSDGGTNGAAYRDSSGLLHGTATGGAGTLCLTSTDGSVPVFASCAGSASTVWSALTAPSANLTLSMAARTTTWTWGATTGASTNPFTITDTTNNTGTGALVSISTASGSALFPFQATAVGTSNGVRMSVLGSLNPLGTGHVNADQINATSLSSLSTGILKNTTTTGIPSIAVAGDFPTLNQSTTGSAATLTTPRAIYGNNFDGSAALGQVIASTYGGTGNGFFKIAGPATSEKTHTWPNQSIDWTALTGVVKMTSGVPSVVSGTASNCVLVDGSSAACGAGGGATTALDNLSAVSINTSLLPQTGVDLGSTTKPFRDLFLWGNGTYGSTYLRLTGTPTGNRVIIFPDANGTVLYGGTDFTFNSGTHTLTGGASSILDQSAGKFLLPTANTAGTGINISTVSGTSQISFNSSVLSGVYAALASSNTFTAANIFTPTSTTEGLRVVSAAIPSTPTAGSIMVGLTGLYHGYSGTNIRTLGYFEGSGVTPATVATGVVHTGASFALTSSAVVSNDLNITTSTCSGVQAITAISATSVGTCTVPTAASHSISAAYTTVLGDANTFLYHPSADTTARTWTLDSNTNVAYPVNTCITFFNDTSAGVLTIAITTDTLVLAGAGTTGSRTLAANGVATACKMTTTRWMINGTGLT